MAESSGNSIIIDNIINYNNQIYHQNAKDEARFAMNDEQQVTFGEKV